MSRANTVSKFIEIHKQQLESSGVPEHFWEKLYSKLINQTFDAGLSFALLRIDYEEEDRLPSEPLWRVQVKVKCGIQATDPAQIYLVDHAWTYRVINAKNQLEEIPDLLDRMSVLMGIDPDEERHTRIDKVFQEMWKYNQSYYIANAINIEDKLPIWYIMDELGCGIQHSDDPNFRCIPFVYLPEQIPYTLLFAIKDVGYGQEVTRNYVEGAFNELERKCLLLPWIDDTFLDIDFKQIEPDENYFLAGHIEETIPNNLNLSAYANGLDIKKKLKVFTEYKYVENYLTDPYFVLTENEEEADILWLTRHFKNYKELSENSPNKFINQFPYEYIITVKDLLSVICRRNAKMLSYDEETLETFPSWLPTTYNLTTELSKFVSYYEHRDEKGLENTWICKPYNLARSLDIHITDNINYIVRLVSTGPKIAQKYIHKPVLFYRSDINDHVKFDVRYVILVQSLSPIQVYIYRNFFLRFANVPFSMEDFEVYEKHFTVMNYDSAENLLHMPCSEFLIKWNEQYSEYNWQDIENTICSFIRAVFEAATEKEPPCGICDNKQSKALYAADIMLEWMTNEKGEMYMQPKLLEINWIPDCQRACQYYPSFYNDVFSLLFLNMVNENVFKLVQ